MGYKTKTRAKIEQNAIGGMVEAQGAKEVHNMPQAKPKLRFLEKMRD